MRFFPLPLFPPSFSLCNFLLSPYSSWLCLDVTAKARATDSLRPTRAALQNQQGYGSEGARHYLWGPFSLFLPVYRITCRRARLRADREDQGFWWGVVGRCLRNPFFWVTEPRWPQEVVERFSSLGARGRLTTGTSSLGLRGHFNSSSSSRPPVCYV